MNVIVGVRAATGGGWGGEHPNRRGGKVFRGMLSRKRGKGITLEMQIRNTQVNKKINKKRKNRKKLILFFDDVKYLDNVF